MDLFKKEIHDFYDSIDEEVRLTRTNANRVEFLTTTKYIDKLCNPKSKILDACAGAGIYALHLADNHSVVAGDLVESNVEQMKKEKQNLSKDLEIYTGNILDLTEFEDASFDVVLNLGSYYHLIEESDRVKSVNECLRVLKPGGLYFMAYINKYANLVKYRSDIKDNFDSIESYLENGYNDDNSLFYATSPENLESFMQNFNIKKLHNIATDGLKFINKETINNFTDEEFTRWMDIHYEMCETQSLLGYSEHALYIAKKKSL